MDRLSELHKVKDILTQVDYKTLTSILNSYVPRIPASIIDFKNEKFEFRQIHAGGMNLLYRGRLFDETKISFPNIKDISFVPSDKLHTIKQYGRVNKPGESMFYASTALETACVETFSKGENFDRLKKENGLTLVVGTWLIEQPMTLAHMACSEKYFESFSEEAKSLNLKKVTLETIKKQNEHLRTLFDNDEDYQILSFFSDEFAKINTLDHNEHKISNYYADRIFNRIDGFKMQGEVDGIWYPSVPSSYQEINFVLPPSKVQEKLKFLWADIIWVAYSSDTKQIQFIPLEQRAHANEQGVIQWRTKSIG